MSLSPDLLMNERRMGVNRDSPDERSICAPQGQPRPDACALQQLGHPGAQRPADRPLNALCEGNGVHKPASGRISTRAYRSPRCHSTYATTWRPWPHEAAVAAEADMPARPNRIRTLRARSETCASAISVVRRPAWITTLSIRISSILCPDIPDRTDG